jgi:hypothetical protein
MNKKLISLAVIGLLLPSFASAEGLLSYKPPKVGTLKNSVGGGTRSLETPKIQVLAPKQIALTNQAQPILYLYSLEFSPQEVEIILIEDGSDKPLLEKRLSVTQGLKSVNLADYGVSLQQGKKYQWSVSVLNTSESTRAGIMYQTSATSLSTVEQQAENGYWYDALEQLVENHSPLANDLVKQIGFKTPIF